MPDNMYCIQILSCSVNSKWNVKNYEELNILNYEELKKSINYFRCYFSNTVIVSELNILNAGV